MQTTITDIRPTRRASDTGDAWLDRLKKHLAEVDKLIEWRDEFGWADQDQRQAWCVYRGELAVEIHELDEQGQMRRLSRGRRRGPE